MSSLPRKDDLEYADRVHRLAARTLPDAFIEYVLRDENGGMIAQAQIHKEWQRLAGEHKNFVLWAFVESGKTQQISVGRVLWEIGRNPSIRVAIVSNTQDQAASIVQNIAKYVEQSDALRRVFPDLRQGAVWMKNKITVKRPTISRDPTIQACGAHGNILGSRIDLLVMDDMLDYENCRTPALRDDLFRWQQATLVGRLTRKSRVWVLGNAFHPDDMLHRLAKLVRWYAARYPVRDPKTGGSRWPEIWPVDRIEERRGEMIPVEFARQMLCQARDDTEARFKQEWIDKAIRRGKGRRLAYALERVPDGCRVFTGVDLGVQKHRAAGSTVLFTILVHPTGDREVLNVEAGKWGGPDIVQRIIDAHRRYQSIVVVENNAAQAYIVQFTRGVSAVPVQPFTTGRNKAHPEFGIESIAAEMAGGKWVIPNEDGKLDPEVQEWINEMLYYDPTAHTGDRLMACLAPGAKITTARGLVSVESVVAGDKVLTHRGRFRTVTGTTRREYAGDMVELKPAGMPMLLVTPEHPVWVAGARFKRDDRSNRLIPAEWDWRDAAEVRAGRKLEGDFVLAPVPHDWPGMASRRIDLSAFVGKRELAWGGRWHVGDEEMSWRNERSYPRWLHVDEEAALLFGLYLAEGWIAGRHQVCFAFHRREHHLAEFVSEQMTKLFGAARPSVYCKKGHGGMTVASSSVLAARLFGALGKRSAKGLPWEWMGWPLQLRLAIVRGWFMGDGHVARNAGGRFLSAVSVAPSIIYQTQLTLWEAGLSAMTEAFPQSGSFQGRPCSQLPATRLRLSCRDSASLLLDATDVEKAHWPPFDATRDRTNTRAVAIPEGMAMRVASVEMLEGYSGPIFNLHIKEDESFVANGIAVHNSWFAREGVKMRSKKVEYGRIDLMAR